MKRFPIVRPSWSNRSSGKMNVHFLDTKNSIFIKVFVGVFKPARHTNSYQKDGAMSNNNPTTWITCRSMRSIAKCKSETSSHLWPPLTVIMTTVRENSNDRNLKWSFIYANYLQHKRPRRIWCGDTWIYVAADYALLIKRRRLSC